MPQRHICLEKANNKETVVAIHRLPHQAHSLAKILNGAFTSMEEVESRDLMKWAEDIENSLGTGRATNIIDFASTCMTEVSSALSTIKKKLEKGDKTATKKLQYAEIFEILVKITDDNNLPLILDAFKRIEQIPERVLFRKELWRDMNKAIEEKISSKEDISLRKTAYILRDRGRIYGRTFDKRIVSRTLLIKGLEFDHAIVANADDLDAKELYVAITRGSKSLTVFSSNPIIQKVAPTDLIPPKS